VVTGNIEYRSGTLKKTTYSKPDFAIKDAKAEVPWTPPVAGDDVRPPAWPAPPTLPELEKMDYQTACGDLASNWVNGGIDGILGSWGSNPVSQSIKSIMKGVLGRLASYLGQAVGWVLDNVMQPAMDRGLKETMDKSIGFAQDSVSGLQKEVDGAIKRSIANVDKMRTSINTNIKASIDDTLGRFGAQLNVNVTEAISELNSKITDSVGRSLDNLYLSIGLPKGQLMSPAQIADVTSTGFKFYSLGPGTVLNYTAMSAFVRQAVDVGRPEDGGDDDGSMPFPFLPPPPPFMPPL